MSSVFDIASTHQPIHKSAQRMRWFIRSFEEQLDDVSRQTGNSFALDQQALAEAFSDWLGAFEAQKPKSAEDRQAYVGFASGLMLEQLLRHDPARLTSGPADADKDQPVHYWPEGYLYVSYCLKVRGLVLERDFHGQQTPGTALEDIRTWWSFRENTREDPALARPFLDLFAGDEPNWAMYQIFQSKGAPALGASPVRPKIDRTG